MASRLLGPFRVSSLAVSVVRRSRGKGISAADACIEAARRRCAATRAPGARQGAIEVANDVVHGFEADRYADHVGSRARRLALLGGELAMRRRRRMQDERTRVADIGEMRPELAALDDFDAGLVAAFDAEGEDRAGPAGEIFP